MTSHKAEADVPYTAQQMYALVADVERYPEFLPWCLALRIVDKSLNEAGGTLTADMLVAYKVFREKFRTKVTLDSAACAIDTFYIDGPFRRLENKWRFNDRPEGGSHVVFEIDFEFSNRLLQATARAVFEKAFLRMSDAFVARAGVIYGAQEAPMV